MIEVSNAIAFGLGAVAIEAARWAYNKYVASKVSALGGDVDKAVGQIKKDL